MRLETRPLVQWSESDSSDGPYSEYPAAILSDSIEPERDAIPNMVSEDP